MVNLDALTANVQSLQLALAEANADVVLLTRLKSAETDAKRLTIELATAQDDLVTGLADEVAAKRKAAFARFTNVSVEVSVDAIRPNAVLAASYTINVEKMVYDSKLHRSVPTTISYLGFTMLPSDAYEYLIEVKPHKLPAIILALAPGDPVSAMSVYFLGLRRGYLG